MMVTVGRLRSGKTSTGSRGTVNAPNTTSTNASASTSRRLRSEWVTRNVNIGGLFIGGA
jgi:hypothetical protein